MKDKSRNQYSQSYGDIKPLKAIPQVGTQEEGSYQKFLDEGSGLKWSYKYQ